jgi:DNA repair protein RecO (recombination protein O)
MDWRDEGVVISVRKHGETSVIVDILTMAHGRHSAVVRGGVSRRMTPVLQPGNQVSVEWHARLEEHLGSYRVELIHSRSSIMADRAALAALASVCGLVGFGFPERMVLSDLYESTLAIVDSLDVGADWPRIYALWELQVLDELGYGLDLSNCAVTGSADDLVFVSPRSGRAVSRRGAGNWAQKLLPLPSFLRDRGDADISDVLAALTTTGYFLQTRLAAGLGHRPLPAARMRFISVLNRIANAKRH